MKRYENNFNSDIDYVKKRTQEWKREHDAGGFRCSHCKQFVVIHDMMGTANRNHCNHCLWSRHVDENKGDRRAACHGGMEPIGLTFKHEGYGKIGEIMIIHLCSLCQKISINRIARDDPEDRILEIFEHSHYLSKNLKKRLSLARIYLLNRGDAEELNIQLFGK